MTNRLLWEMAISEEKVRRRQKASGNPVWNLMLPSCTFHFNLQYQNDSSIISLFAIAPAKLPADTALATERIIEALSPQASIPGMDVF